MQPVVHTLLGYTVTLAHPGAATGLLPACVAGHPTSATQRLAHRTHTGQVSTTGQD